MSDNINHPAHYAEDREIEPIALIEDWDLSFSLGNAIKYISRAGRKDAEKIVEDLKKAIWYINREKEFGKFGISTIIKYNIRKWFIDAYSVEEVLADWKPGYDISIAIHMIYRSLRCGKDDRDYMLDSAVEFIESFIITKP